MSSSPTGQHAAGGPPPDHPPAPEPSYAERARTLVHLGRVGSLSTLSRKQPGWPFGSVMPYGLDALGRPLLLISSMAMHTQNLVADPRASLLVTQSDGPADPLGAGRVTLLGNVTVIPEADRPEARQLYLNRYGNARSWVDYDDFAFYRMQIVDIYFVGGFGVMGWVSAESYTQAAADPLADAAPGILQHMNADHADSLVLLARAFAGLEADQAAMTSIDRLGFHVRLHSGERIHGARIAFPREVRTTEEVRATLVAMVRQARAL